ncbi:hypothetical protein HK104_009393 [Borealophlyctis nickersoniae]|nr:hypothetical protein HK104_009393 [Borealophlyctis nickersoniae]
MSTLFTPKSSPQRPASSQPGLYDLLACTVYSPPVDPYFVETYPAAPVSYTPYPYASPPAVPASYVDDEDIPEPKFLYRRAVPLPRYQPPSTPSRDQHDHQQSSTSPALSLFASPTKENFVNLVRKAGHHPASKFARVVVPR